MPEKLTGEMCRRLFLQADDAAACFALRDHLAACGNAADSYLADMAGDALLKCSAENLFRAGTTFYLLGRHEEATKFYRLAFDADPEPMAVLHRNLSINLWGEGRFADAQYHRDLAFRHQRIFVEHASPAEKTILILCSGTRGDVPVDALIANKSYRLVKWVIEYAPDVQNEVLPPYDIVFNAIGDADVAERTQHQVATFLRNCNKPILNPPQAIARTSRDRIPDLLRNIDNVFIPAATRIATAAIGKIPSETAPRDFPLLLRPIAGHGGEFLVKLDTPDALSAFSPAGVDEYYLCGYREYRSADGHFRKYRIVFVDREPYPYHLAISRHWMVHYQSAMIPAEPWKIAEEQKFLDDPAGVIGQQAMTAIAAIGREIDLDFAGIDFSILPDGRVLLFEVNATMLVHAEDGDGAFGFKNACVQKITDAFERHLASCMRAP